MIRTAHARLSIAGRVCLLCTQMVFSGLCLARSPAVLAEAPTAGDAAEDARYRTSIKDALAEYDAHHFEEARILFRRAHDISPNARTLRGIGMASFELRDYVAAVRALSAALTETRKELNSAQRTHTQGLLDRSRMYVDVYTLKITPAGARVLIDGRAPELEADGTVLLGFGNHGVEVSATGYSLRVLTVKVRGGERKELAIDLEPGVQEPVFPLDTATPKLSTTTPSPKRLVATTHTSDDSNWGWYLATAGVAAVGTGVAAYWWYGRNSEIDSCRKTGYYCPNLNQITTDRSLAIGTTLGAAGVALTMGIVSLVSWSSTPSEPAQHHALLCAPFVTGLTCATRF